MKPKTLSWILFLSLGVLTSCRSEPTPVVPENASVELTPSVESKASVEVPSSPEGPAYIEERGIVYANVQDVELKLDLYRPVEGDGPFPTIVFIFGGGFMDGGRAGFWAQSRLAAERGYVTVTIDYRLTSVVDEEAKPKYLFPAQIHDVKCAVRWLRSNAQNLGIDPGRIGAAGWSSGGYLALMLALTDPSDGLEGDCGDLNYSSRVQAAVNLAGGMDLAAGHGARDPSCVGYVRRLLGGGPDERPEEYRLASPISHGSEDDPPILTLLGEQDSCVPPQYGELFDLRMRETGVPHTLIILDEPHSYFGGAWPDLYKTVFEFFDRHLK